MRNKTKTTAAVIALLFTAILVFCTPSTVFAETLHTKEVTVTDVDLDDHIDERIQGVLADSDHEAEGIAIVGKVLKEVTLETEYIAKYADAKEPDGIGEVDDFFSLTLNGSYDTVESLKKDIEAAILKQYPNFQSVELINNLSCDKIVYDVQYKYSDELVIGEELKLPCTKADGQYELSPLTLYISRCRISYVIEDGGEFYIPEDDYNFLIWENSQYLLERINFLDGKQYAYYNVDYQFFKKAGTVVGKLDKLEKDYNFYAWYKKDRYTIGHETYYRLSDIVDWKKDLKLFKYDEKTKTLYYGKKPTKKDKLQKDDIYEFTKKAIKGCKTDKEKLRAIHDAIVSKYDSYEELFHLDSFPGYVMRDNLYDAKKLMKDKVYKIDSFADLFKECCNRLLIPCNSVNDSFLYWNRVYLGDKCYHVDTVSDAKVTHSTKNNKIYRGFFLKSSYEFMGTHIWEGDDYTPEKFSKNWKNINRNNIKTTDDLRRAASYASYLSRNGKKHTYTFKIKGKNVNTYCEAYVFHYGYISNINASYSKGILTIKFN